MLRWGMALKTRGFQSPIDLADHFQKHGHEFGVQESTDYETLADEFLSGPVRPTQHQCRRKHGDTLRFDCTTDEFGALSAHGIIRTYYRLNLRKHRHPSNTDYFVDGCKK